MDGYIKLHRKLLSSAIFDNPNLLKVFMWCLLKASYQERDQVVGLQTVKLLPGQFIYGRVKAGDELRMNPSTAHRYMLRLKSFGNVDIKANNKFSVVTVANWGLYQSESKNADGKADNKWTTNEQQMDTNKKVKKEKNNTSSSPPAPKAKFEHDSNPYQGAQYLARHKANNFPKLKPPTEQQLQQWADAIDKLHRIDGYEWEDISDTLRFAMKDDFWQKTILSGQTFRKQFEKIYTKAVGGERK